MISLDVERLTVRYGRAVVLHECSLRVEEGQAVGVFGANGAGKSSLLRAIAGIVPSSGTVRLGGQDVSRWPAERRARAGIALVPEGRHTFPHLSVAENLRVGGYRLSRDELARSTERMNDLFPVLGERRDQLAGTLSGGQQQMLEVARALMAAPRLLLVDEPSFGLAPNAVAALYERFEALREQGVAMVLVEQQVERARSRVDAALVLRLGEVAMSGPPGDLPADGLLTQAYAGARGGVSP